MENNEEKPLSLGEIVEKLGQTIESEGDVRQEVTSLKSLFYRTLEAETNEKRRQWVEDGNDAKDFVYTPAEEAEFKETLEKYKIRHNREVAEREAAYERAYALKSDILKKLKELTESLDEGDVNFQEIKKLQQQWKDAGQAAPDKYKELIKEYQACMDKFYDYSKINHELKNYDFKKNLEAKTELCERAEALKDSNKINESFQQLQKLHEEWKELGPVAPEKREEIWQRFKAASDEINHRHADFYKNKKENEEENLQKKTALCEQVEAIDYKSASSFKQWDEISENVKQIQAEWKKLGFAPKKVNGKIYDRFRAACDAIFKAKSEFYKELKARNNENLEKKKELCRQAEELKDSTDWKDTADKMIKLQQEWKKAGPVSGKAADQIWKRFISACDYFFEQRNKNVRGAASQAKSSLAREREKLMKRYDTLSADIKTRENNIGFLDFDEKNPNPLIEGMRENIEKLKKEQEKVLQKIRSIEESMIKEDGEQQQ